MNDNIAPESGAEQMDTQLLAELLKKQVDLSDTVQSTAGLLRFALQVANNNLMAMRDQLATIQTLATQMEQDAEEGRAP